MSTVDKLKNSYPLPLTKLYNAAKLETDPRLEAQKLVELFDGLVRYLALIGLASYVKHQLVHPDVEVQRSKLGRPSLGTWFRLLLNVSTLLDSHNLHLLGDFTDRNHNSDAIGDATRRLTIALDKQPRSGRLRLEQFLETVVEFRNRRIGHGSLSKPQAREVVQPLEAALLLWLSELTVLEQYKLVHLARVELYENGQFRYQGYDLNAGELPWPFALISDKPLSGDRTYLFNTADGEFLPLYPFFLFDDDFRVLLVYSELSSRDVPILRCPYEVAGSDFRREVSISPTSIVGVLTADSTEEAPQASARASRRGISGQPQAEQTPIASETEQPAVAAEVLHTEPPLLASEGKLPHVAQQPQVEQAKTAPESGSPPVTAQGQPKPLTMASEGEFPFTSEHAQAEQIQTASGDGPATVGHNAAKQRTAPQFPSAPAPLTFYNVVERLESRIRQVCRSGERYPVLWVVGEPCSGKTAIARAVCQRTGWQYIDMTLDSGRLDRLIGQEETYRPEDFLTYLQEICKSDSEVIIVDEIEPLLSWWTWDEQQVFFRTIARATRLKTGVTLVTRLRTSEQLEKVVPSKTQVFEIPKGVELWAK